jgi:dTDP-glucose 4,6-dehydratase
MRALVTGGAGFIGSALVRALVRDGTEHVVTVDALTYAGNVESLGAARTAPNHVLAQIDIADQDAVRSVIAAADPDVVYHLAAESHVDRSIDGPRVFVETNVVGTYTMLAEALRHWRALDAERRERFRFVHVSTDEVFGSLGPTGFFDESTAYDPSSPYSATKAASDHLARAWHRTYGLPVVVTNCSNNYGPYQFPEKLIPHMIVRAVDARPLPVYGAGTNVRDWLHVDDHVSALRNVAASAEVGGTYLISGRNEQRNIDVVRAICAALDEQRPRADGRPYAEMIEFVTDRPGHDLRYAIDASRTETRLRWRAAIGFEQGLRETVRWYLENESWWRRILSGEYRADRVGLAETHTA